MFLSILAEYAPDQRPSGVAVAKGRGTAPQNTSET